MPKFMNKYRIVDGHSDGDSIPVVIKKSQEDTNTMEVSRGQEEHKVVAGFDLRGESRANDFPAKTAEELETWLLSASRSELISVARRTGSPFSTSMGNSMIATQIRKKFSRVIN